MGNRAVITNKAKEIGVYLHWNGGRDSVEAFLKYCELQQFRNPDQQNYGWARLCQVISNFFGPDGLSVGIDTLENLPSSRFLDNGIYIIEGWQIVGRELYGCEEVSECQEQRVHSLPQMLKAIDEQQPADAQLFEDMDLVEIEQWLKQQN